MVLPLLLLKERSINKDKPYLASFVQRLGRITSAQKEALKLLDRFKLIDETQLLGFASDYKKVILDIGFGNGESTVYIANSNPEALVVASEVYKSGIGSLLGSIVENSIGNIKIFDKDIRELSSKIDVDIFNKSSRISLSKILILPIEFSTIDPNRLPIPDL
jgi:tRNA G46 methylase TrmB